MGTVRQRLRYSIDGLFARGTTTLLVVLGVVVVLVMASVSVAVVSSGDIPNEDMSVVDIVWTVFAYMYDPSSVGYDEGGWTYRILLLGASLVGVIVLSTFIGIITNGFSNMLETLRKGRSTVLESKHTLILGWSERIYGIVSELAIANENVKQARIVILAHEDKVDMEDRLRERISLPPGTKVICRSGSPLDMTDLDIVAPTEARSIIVIAPDDHENPDAFVVKTLLALIHKDPHGTSPIVATMQDVKNIEVASIIGRERVRLIPNELVISQIITQTCRQPGLSMVYTELLDFGGDELYFTRIDSLVGKTFADILLDFEDSTVFGIKRPNRGPMVNPPMDMIIEDGDEIIALSADDDTVVVRTTPRPEIDEAVMVSSPAVKRSPERILVLGWNSRGTFIMHELDQYVAFGSTIDVIDRLDHSLAVQELDDATKNIEIRAKIADTTHRSVLDAAQLTSYDSVIVLADMTLSDPQEADARTLMTLIHVRDIVASGDRHVNIVTEMLDDRNRQLASVSATDDFIVSNKITSLLLTQVAENPDLSAVFADLFDAAGSELYLKPAYVYVKTGTEVNFATVVASALRRGEIAIGHRRVTNGSTMVDVNVPKSSRFVYSESDMIVVLAVD
ncbi:MAG TPA: NAD-binding protein [Chlorobiota bacterium]|nr:NAD-binding protein [Chlorobiota bacterium]